MKTIRLIMIALVVAATVPALAAASVEAGTDAAVTGEQAKPGDPTTSPVTLPADVPSPAVDSEGAAQWSYDAFASGRYWAGAGMILLFAIIWLRKIVAKIPKLGPWFTTTDQGGTTFTLITSVATVLGVGLVADNAINWELVETGVLYGVSAAAGWSIVWKRLIRPVLKRIAA